MGNIIGILSTVILVSTLATLIFAVGAYMLARKRRRSGDPDLAASDDAIPERTEPLTVPPGRTEPAQADTAELKPSPAGKTSSPPEDAPPAAADVKPAKNAAPVFRRLTPHGEKPVGSEEIVRQDGWDWE